MALEQENTGLKTQLEDLAAQMVIKTTLQFYKRCYWLLYRTFGDATLFALCRPTK